MPVHAQLYNNYIIIALMNYSSKPLSYLAFYTINMCHSNYYLFIYTVIKCKMGSPLMHEQWEKMLITHMNAYTCTTFTSGFLYSTDIV